METEKQFLPSNEVGCKKKEEMAAEILKKEAQFLSEFGQNKILRTLVAIFSGASLFVKADLLNFGDGDAHAKRESGAICPLIKPIEKNTNGALKQRQELIEEIDNGDYFGKQNEDDAIENKKLLNEKFPLEENNPFLVVLLETATGEDHDGNITSGDLVQMRSNYAIGKEDAFAKFKYFHNIKENGNKQYIDPESIDNNANKIKEKINDILEEEIGRGKLLDKDLVNRIREAFTVPVLKVIESGLENYFGELKVKDALDKTIRAESNKFEEGLQRLLNNNKRGEVKVNDFVDEFNELLNELTEKLNGKAGLTLDFSSCHIQVESITSHDGNFQEETTVEKIPLEELLEEQQKLEQQPEGQQEVQKGSIQEQEQLDNPEQAQRLKDMIVKEYHEATSIFINACDLYNEEMGFSADSKEKLNIDDFRIGIIIRGRVNGGSKERMNLKYKSPKNTIDAIEVRNYDLASIKEENIHFSFTPNKGVVINEVAMAKARQEAKEE